MRLLSCPSHIQIDSHVFAMSAMDSCSLIVSVPLRFVQVYSCSWKCFYIRVFSTVACFFERGAKRDKDRLLTSFSFHIRTGEYTVN